MSSLFGIKTPQVPKPVSMPDQEDPALLEKRRRAMLDAQSRGGRQSTILSGEAPSYSNTTLGN